MENKNKKIYNIKNVSFEGFYISLLVDEKPYKIDLREHSNHLAFSNEKIKNNYVISPSGYGIHWEDIDEDLSIDGLIKSKEKPDIYKKIKPKRLIMHDKTKVRKK
jgi:hypothetical protein